MFFICFLMICSAHLCLSFAEGDILSDLSNLFDVGRAKRQIRELEKENEELQAKVTELEILRGSNKSCRYL
jgi:hypothetical protein